MIRYKLPEYPCKKDVWDTLSEERRPIVVYGMGNGADKLFDRFEKYGITVAEVFASDGFVRGHSYRGYKVLSFSDIKEKYSDFVIVLSFASNRSEVIEMFSDIDKKHDMYIPDMPVANIEEYFDREFYNANYDRIRAVYDMLADDESKNIYSAVLNYKLTGRLSYLLDSCSDKAEMYSLISNKKIRSVIDAGAYNGDTAREAEEYFPSLESIYAIEPDKRNFKKLSKYAEESKCNMTARNAAVWCECSEGVFMGSGNRNSSISSTASYENRVAECELITIDCLGLSPDYIKYDVEGAELEALTGSLETIRRSTPSLLVSIYHRSRDIFSLAELLRDNTEGYKFYIRRLPSVPAWELNLILIHA